MSKKEKKFSKGEILFKKGETCENIFTIEEGKVDLFDSPTGTGRRIGSKTVNQILGEDDLLNEGFYSKTAKALTDVIVEVQSREEFILNKQKKGALAPTFDDEFNLNFDSNDGDFDLNDFTEESVSPVKNKRKQLSKNESKNEVQVKHSDNQALVKVEPLHRTVQPLKNSPIILSADAKKSSLTQWFQENQNKIPVAFGPILLLAQIDGDTDNKIVLSLYEILKTIPNLQVHLIDKPILDVGYERARLQMLSWIDQYEADFGLYAQPDNAGRILEFHIVNTGVQKQTYNIGTRFFMPISMDETQQKLFQAFCVSTMVPRRLEQEQILRLFLPNLLNSLIPYAQKPMIGLSSEEQGVNLVCFANALSLIGLSGYMESKTSIAFEIYKEAIKLLPIYAPEYVFVTRQVGLLQQIEGEKNRDLSSLKDAENTFLKALSVISGKMQPDVFADLNLRVGNVRQNIAIQSGNGQDFANAIKSYKDALGTFSPQKNLEKWADAMNGLAKTLQIFSSYSTKTTLLSKSIEIYERELSALNKEANSILWARTANNLASALFALFEKENHDISILRRAVDVFSEALAVYDNLGQPKMAEVAQKNLKKAEFILKRTEKEFEENKNWLDDIVQNDYNEDKSAEKNEEEPLTFERIAVFEELDE